MRNIGAFHQSTIGTFSFYGCPRKVWYDWVQKVKPDRRYPKALAGSAIHHCLSLIAGHEEQFVAGEKALPWDLGWKKAVENPVDPLEKDVDIYWYPDEDTQFAQLTAEALQMILGFCANVPKREVVLNEEKFNLTLGKYDWEGTLDQIWKMPDGRYLLIDFKSGAELPHDDTIIESPQFGLYALAAEKCFGIKVDGFAWIHLRDYIRYGFREAVDKKTGSIEYKKTRSYKDPKASQRNSILQSWIEQNAVDQTDAGKYVFESGQMKGRGIYAYAALPEWFDSREEQLTSLAGLLTQVNPVANPSKNCLVCRHRNRCRGDIYKVPMDQTVTEESISQYNEFLMED